MELEGAQEAFVGLLGQIRGDSKLKFLEWVCQEYNPVITSEGESGRGNTIEEEQEQQDTFDKIAQEIREAVPPTAMAPGEEMVFHPSCQRDGMNATNTLHVDSFLYPNEEDVDSLCERLEISRNHCLNCGSWKTAPLNFISHSVSKEQVKHIFCNLIPDVSGKVVVDVGSRLGPVLYGAHAYSRASKIIGIESNIFFSDVQQRVISRYQLEPRVQVICSDLRLQGAVLQSADVVIVNNVFEFLCSLEQQASIWEFLFQSVQKRGTLIVSMPSIQESCSQLTFKSPLTLTDWAREISTGIDPQDEELGSLHLYCVL